MKEIETKKDTPEQQAKVEKNAKKEASEGKKWILLVLGSLCVCLIAVYASGLKLDFGGLFSPAANHGAIGFDTLGMPTKRPFPVPKGKPLTLVSAAMRKKFGVVDVYKVGYFIPDSKFSELSKQVKKGDFAKGDCGLVLEFVRGVKADAVVKALVEALKDIDKKVLEAFQSALLTQMNGSVATGDIIEFHLTGKDNVSVRVRDNTPILVKGETLKTRLVGIYTGEKSIVPDMVTILNSKFPSKK